MIMNQLCYKQLKMENEDRYILRHMLFLTLGEAAHLCVINAILFNKWGQGCRLLFGYHSITQERNISVWAPSKKKGEDDPELIDRMQNKIA